MEGSPSLLWGSPLLEEAVAPFEEHALAQDLGEEVSGIVDTCDFDGTHELEGNLLARVVEATQNMFGLGTCVDDVLT